MRKSNLISLFLVFVMLLSLTGCSAKKEADGAPAAFETEPIDETEAFSSGDTAEVTAGNTGNVVVTTADEFLSAIAPNTEIKLGAEKIDLTQASDYGKEKDDGWYTWESVYDGYELVIENCSGLTLKGAGMGSTELVSSPRYSSVIHFRSCSSITVSNMTLGHSEGPGDCFGPVLYLDNCSDALIDGCDMYGCGTEAVYADSSKNIRINGSNLRNCSNGALEVYNCEGVTAANCSIYENGIESEYGAYSVVSIINTKKVLMYNCTVERNRTSIFLNNNLSSDVYILGNNINTNEFSDAVFNCSGPSVHVSDCSFSKNIYRNWFGTVDYGSNSFVLDKENKVLNAEALSGMEYNKQPDTLNIDDVIPNHDSSPLLEGKITYLGNLRLIEVSTVEEFLAAIGPDTRILLGKGEFNLSSISSENLTAGEYYRWRSVYDGAELIITGVNNFQIWGSGKDKTTITVEPRYANVLTFEYCSNVRIADLTAGHTEEPGTCSGGVFNFTGCTDTEIMRSGMFGCGICGITAYDCTSMNVTDSEIYDCSECAIQLDSCYYFYFYNCDVHGCGKNPYHVIETCFDINFNGENLC